MDSDGHGATKECGRDEVREVMTAIDNSITQRNHRRRIKSRISNECRVCVEMGSRQAQIGDLKKT